MSDETTGPKPLQTDKFERDDMVAIKCRNMPWRIENDEIENFFRDFKYLDKSVVLEIGEDGRKTGFGGILMESEEQADEAVEALNNADIGGRSMRLQKIAYRQYLNFNKPKRPEPEEAKPLSEYVTPSNKDRILFMRGCPWRVTVDEIIEFFKDFEEIKPENVAIEEEYGRRTGCAIVIISDPDVLQEARQELNRKEIGTRFILLNDIGNPMVKQKLNLE